MKYATPTDYLCALLADAGTAELRHHDGNRWASGWFDDPIRMQNAAAERQHSGNLYTSLNAPKPRVVTNAMQGSPITNDAVGWIVRIPFDFDPHRPTGTASTQDELSAALARRDGLTTMLRKAGWPLPLIGMSGNGAHAQYRCRLPSNDETAEIIRIIYTGLSAEFGDDEVDFDQTVRNPGRIFRLYGSVNRKGPDSIDRPHRVAACQIPRPWRQVGARAVERLANRYARQQQRQPTASIDRSQSGFQALGKGDYQTLDAVAWFAAHGLYRFAIGDQKHSVWCPWREGHSTPHGRTGAVVFEARNNWPGFFCHHGSCAGRTIADVMQLFGDADAFCREQFQGGRAS